MATWHHSQVKKKGATFSFFADDAALDDILADDALGIAAEEDAVREDARAFAGALARADNVQEVGGVAPWEVSDGGSEGAP